MATDPLRRLQEELRHVENPTDLPPDLLLVLETLAAAFGTSLEAMRDRVILSTSKDRPILGLVNITPGDIPTNLSSRLAELVADGTAALPKRAKRQRSAQDLIPVSGSVSEFVVEDRRR
jgi:hypothetical protein